MNVLKTLNISVAFYGKFATFTNFYIIHFFSKNPSFFRKKWTFWEIVIFAEKSHSTTILLSLAILKNSCFFRKTSSSFPIKIDVGTFWEFLLFLSHSTANLLNSPHFIILKTKFLQKPISVSRNPKIWTFWEVLEIQSLSTGSLLHLAVYNTFISVLDKPIFCLKN